jgi:hypothetical protein
MWRVTDKFRVVLGGNTYVNVRDLVVCQGKSLFTLRRSDDGVLGIDFDIYGPDGPKRNGWSSLTGRPLLISC